MAGVGRVGSGRGETAQGFRAVRRAGGTTLGGPQLSPWADVFGELGGVEAGGLGAQLPPWPGPDGAQERTRVLGTGPSGPGAPCPHPRGQAGPASCAFTPRRAAGPETARPGSQPGGGWGPARGFPPHPRAPRALQWLPGRVQTAWAPASRVRAPGPDVEASC